MKKIVVMIMNLVLLLSLLGVNSEVSASEFESIHSITLKESPYFLGDGWTLDASYNSSRPYSVAIGNKEYVAVGPYGTVMKSKDGQNWKALSKFGNYQLTTIAWDGTKYLMFGANTLYDNEAVYKPSEAFISTDGLTWNRIDFEPGVAIYSVEWGKNGFVAVGRGHVFTSKDGVNWTKTLTFKVEYGLNSMKYVHDTYFIFSYEDKKIYTSKDGVKWTSNPYDIKTNITEFIWVKDRFVGVGNGIYTSKDGIKWTKQSKSPKNVSFDTIVTNGQVYIAVGNLQSGSSSTKVSYTSKDGVNWRQNKIANIKVSVYTMYPVNGGFAGIGSNGDDYSDGTYSVFTKDGIKWNYKLAGTLLTGEFSGIATNGKRTVAVGLLGSVIYTDNGTQWKSATPFTYKEVGGRTHLFDVAWGANKFVAVGNGGVYTSTNGVSWAKAKINMDQYGQLRDIIWTGKFFVASSQVNGVYTSKDGLSWTKVNSVSKEGQWLQDMVWDGKRLVAAFQILNNAKSYIQMMETKNGTTWTKIAKLDISEADIAWNGKQYIAINPYNPSLLRVSTDGKTWTKGKVSLNESDNISFVTSFNGNFVAFNNGSSEVNAYYVSKDGIKWTKNIIPNKNPMATFGEEMMKDGINAHGYYIFVGASGNILYTKQLKF